MENKQRYTVEPGRWIHRDGKPFIAITRYAGTEDFVSPTEVDEVTHEVCKFLNSKKA